MIAAPTSTLLESSDLVSKEARASLPRISGPVRSLAPGDCLFQKGDRQTQLYRVVHGALCHYMRWGDGTPRVIEFVFKDDIIGFAHGEEHITTARALVPTEVAVVAPQEFVDALETDGCLAARVAAAADREFEYLRFCAVRAGKGRPAMRVASFLAALVRMRVREGRDPELVASEVSSAIIAEALHMSVNSLAAAVMELERRGLIQLTPGGLRIVDVDLLESLFD